MCQLRETRVEPWPNVKPWWNLPWNVLAAPQNQRHHETWSGTLLEVQGRATSRIAAVEQLLCIVQASNPMLGASEPGRIAQLLLFLRRSKTLFELLTVALRRLQSLNVYYPPFTEASNPSSSMEISECTRRFLAPKFPIFTVSIHNGLVTQPLWLSRSRGPKCTFPNK